MVRRVRSTSPSPSPLPVARATVHGCTCASTLGTVRVQPERAFGWGRLFDHGVSPSISRAFPGPCHDCLSGCLGLSAPYLRRSDRPRRRGAAVQLFRRKVPCDRAPRHRRLPRVPRNGRRSAHALRNFWRGLSAVDVQERRAVHAVGGCLPRQLRGWAPPPPLALVASVVVRALPVLFPPRILYLLWPVKRTALCAVQAPSATSAVATSAASLRPRWQAHGRRSMRPLCRPSTWSPCASCSTAPAPLS